MSVVVGEDEAGGPFAVPDGLANPHALILGASGGGKSTLAYAIIRGRLEKGASLVAVDPEPQTVHRLRGLCAQMKLAPEQVVTIDARDPEAAPGLNPFRAGVHPADAATSVNDLFEKTGAYEGAMRVKAFMKNAITVAAWHGLPLTGILRLLDPAETVYRAALFASPPLHPPSPSYRSAREYLKTDLATFKGTAQNETFQSVRLRFQDLMDNDLFLTMFGATENTVRFDALFSGAKPGAVLVCTHAGRGMTEDGGRLIAGIVFELLFSAATRNPGGREVILAVDEIKTLGPLMEGGMARMVNQARKRNVRLILAGQHTGQLPEALRRDVLASTALQAHFNPGNDETSHSAAALARAGRRGTQQAEPEAEVTPQRIRLYGYNGHRMRDGLVPIVPDPPMPSGEYRDGRPDLRPVEVDPREPGHSLARFMGAAREFLPFVATEDARDIRPIMRDLPPGSARLVWRDRQAWLYVAPPPKPKGLGGKRMDRTEDWIGLLGSLEKGQAFMVVGTERPVKVKVAWHDPPEDAPDSYVAASRRANAAPALPPPGPRRQAPQAVPERAPQQTIPSDVLSAQAPKPKGLGAQAPPAAPPMPEKEPQKEAEDDGSIDFAKL